MWCQGQLGGQDLRPVELLLPAGDGEDQPSFIRTEPEMGDCGASGTGQGSCSHPQLGVPAGKTAVGIY